MTVSKQSQEGTASNCLPVPNVQQRTSDDGQRGCPRRVEFYNGINLDSRVRMELLGSSCILTLLGNSHQKPAGNLPVPMYSRELLMMGREDA
jgi:hypothetical protein